MTDKYKGVHLIDPDELKLKLDPSLMPGGGILPPPTTTQIGPGPGLGYGGGAGMVEDFYKSNLFPRPDYSGAGGGPPGAQFDLFKHYTDPAPQPPGLQLPKLPFGLEGDGDGIGGTHGDWQFRFMPYIPGLNEPDSPDIEQMKKDRER